MTRQIILISGGARSGKSRYAEQRAPEMAQRIAEHQKRRGSLWRTIEEPLGLTEALLRQRGNTDCALVDCLTLWISNLLIRYDQKYATQKVHELMEKLAELDFN